MANTVIHISLRMPLNRIIKYPDTNLGCVEKLRGYWHMQLLGNFPHQLP